MLEIGIFDKYGKLCITPQPRIKNSSGIQTEGSRKVKLPMSIKRKILFKSREDISLPNTRRVSLKI